jgi:hypothetical protein
MRAFSTNAARGGALALLAAWAVGPRPARAADADAIEVEASEVACPGADDLRASLGKHVHTRPGEGQLRLRLEPADERAVRLQLATASGQVVLVRRLERAGSDPGSCRALADTAALMVDRHLREIAYREAPPSAPDIAEKTAEKPAAPAAVAVETRAIDVTPPAPLPTQLLLGVGGGTRAGLGTGGGSARGEVHLALGFEHRRVALLVEAGVATGQDVTAVGAATDVKLRLQAFPLRLLIGLRLRAGAVSILPLAGVGGDLLDARATTAAASVGSWRFEPAAEAGLAARWNPAPGFWLRVTALGGATLQARDYVVDDSANAPAFRTPGAFARLSMEAGVAFGKK